MTSRDERTRKKDDLHLRFADLARGGDVAYSRLHGYFTGGRPQLTDDELQRLDAYFARVEADRHLLGVA